MKKVEFISIKVYCEKLDKNIILDKKDCNFSGNNQECETCGSHGSVSLGFKCECGGYHDIELSSW